MNGFLLHHSIVILFFLQHTWFFTDEQMDKDEKVLSVPLINSVLITHLA